MPYIYLCLLIAVGCFSSNVIPLTKVSKNNLGGCLLAPSNSVTQLGLQNCQSDQYIGTLFIGTPGVNFTVLFDTGSNILWVPVTGCSGQCGSKLFNPNGSSTYNAGTQPMSIQYGDGSTVSGTYGSDVVRFANTTINVSTGILWVNQDSQTDNMQSNGLVGLGYDPQVNNFFDNAYAANQINTSMFSLQLENTFGSLIYFNNIPQNILNSTVFVPQYGTGHWQVQLVGLFVNDVDMTKYAASYTIIDSGTSYFYLNPELFNQVVAQFFSGCNVSSSNVSCPCNYPMPTFTFYYQGIKTYLYPQNYTLNCLALMGAMSGLSGILLGDVFIRNYIVTFDKSNSQLGFKGNLGQIYLVGQGTTQWFYIAQIVSVAVVSLLFLLAIGMFIDMYRSRRRVMVRGGDSYLIEM